MARPLIAVISETLKDQGYCLNGKDTAAIEAAISQWAADTEAEAAAAKKSKKSASGKQDEAANEAEDVAADAAEAKADKAKGKH